MEFGTSSYGKRQLVFKGKGYRLHYKRFNKREEVEYWVCATKWCKGRLNVSRGQIIKDDTTLHTCNPEIDDASMKIQEFRQNLTGRVMTETKPAPKIYNEEKKKFALAHPKYLHRLPRFRNVERSLYRARSSKFPKLPKKREEVRLPADFVTTLRGDRFLLADDGDKDKILVFATDESLRMLEKVENISADGTFQFCPALFTQLYVVLGCIQYSMEYKEYIPLVFAYLPDKKMNTYIRFLTILKSHVPSISCQNVGMDFELAEIGAWKAVFPSINIHLCSFHFNKSLHNGIVTRGLKQLYDEKNSKLKEYMKAIYGISFVPVHLIPSAWMEILEQAPILEGGNQEKLDDFLNYVTNTYITNPNYPLFMWNNYGKFDFRTNNSNESFNSKLRAYDLPKHPNVFRATEVLMDIELEYFCNTKQIQNFLPRKTPKFQTEKEMRLYNKQLQLYNLDNLNLSINFFKYATFCGKLGSCK